MTRPLMLMFMLLLGTATIAAQADLAQVVATCDQAASLQLPQDWVSRQAWFFRNRSFHFASSQALLDDSNLLETEAGLVGGVIFTRRLGPPLSLDDEQDTATMSAEDYLLAMTGSALWSDNAAALSEFSSLAMLDSEMEGVYTVVTGDLQSSYVAGYASADYLGIGFITASPDVLGRHEDTILDILASFSAAPLPDDTDYVTYYSDDCAFTAEIAKDWFAIRRTGEGLYLYNSHEAYDLVSYQNATPIAGMVEIRVHSPDDLDQLISNLQEKATSALALMEYYLRHEANYGLENTLQGDYVALTVAGFPALRANVAMNTHGRVSEGLALVITLDTDQYAVIFAESAPGEMAQFEDAVFAIAESIEFDNGS